MQQTIRSVTGRVKQDDGDSRFTLSQGWHEVTSSDEVRGLRVTNGTIVVGGKLWDQESPGLLIGSTEVKVLQVPCSQATIELTTPD